MKLTPKRKQQIAKSILIKPELKKKILEQWHKLSPAVKNSIIEMLDGAQKTQHEMLRRAYEKNTNIVSDFEGFMKKSEIEALKRTEKVDRKKENAESILDSLN